MKRTEVVRQSADAMHVAEAALEQTLADTRGALERLVAAKTQLGLTGTLGDAAIARVRESVELLERAQEVLIDGHHEAYAVVKKIDFRGEMAWADTFRSARADEEARVA